MVKCYVFAANFIVLDYLCLNILMWAALVAAISTAIIVAVRSTSDEERDLATIAERGGTK